MITTFDLFQVLLPVTLALFCTLLGYDFAGKFGAGLGAALGLVTGWYLGRLPWILTVRSTHKELSKRKTEELVEDLRARKTLIPNFILAELASRGYDISAEIPAMMDFLSSEHSHQRISGFVAVRPAFPALSHMLILEGYSPHKEAEQCRHIVQLVREKLTAQD